MGKAEARGQSARCGQLSGCKAGRLERKRIERGPGGKGGQKMKEGEWGGGPL